MDEWMVEACLATVSRAEDSDPAKRTEIEFLSPRKLAAATALRELTFKDDPSCSAITRVLACKMGLKSLLKLQKEKKRKEKGKSIYKR